VISVTLCEAVRIFFAFRFDYRRAKKIYSCIIPHTDCNYVSYVFSTFGRPALKCRNSVCYIFLKVLIILN